MKKKIIQVLGLGFTIGGVIVAIWGNLTDGVLLMILGELVDLPYRIKDK